MSVVREVDNEKIRQYHHWDQTMVIQESGFIVVNKRVAVPPTYKNDFSCRLAVTKYYY